MRNINIKTKSKSYQVLIGRDLLENIGQEILTNIPSSKGTKLCIVTDTNIDSLYADQVETSLAQAGYRIPK